MAVGGWKRPNYSGISNEVYTYDEPSKEWKSETIPPMPTARHAPCVLGLQSALLVAGGVISKGVNVDKVEIFKVDTSQWHTTDPLPTACEDISLFTIGNTCYAVGGYNPPSPLNKAFHASVYDLLHNAVPANQTTQYSHFDSTQSAWKALPDTPTYQPATAVLAGHLLAVGGRETAEDEAGMKAVYTYSPSTNSWIYISDLPAPRYSVAVAVLSPSEILVIGGWCDKERVNTTYKGTLHL